MLAADALRLRAADLPAPAPTAIVANLPYNVGVPVVLHLLAELPTVRRGLVMVQAEVAERLAAGPGQPDLRGAQRQAGLVRRRPPGRAGAAGGVLAGARRRLRAARLRPPRPAARRPGAVFRLIDAAFAQRRKALRAALAGWAGARTRPSVRCGPPASTRGSAPSDSPSTDFARLAAATP